jgi:glycosyltransferase involved in cell wall biosynthesis
MRILHTEASLGWGGQELRILSEAQGMIERSHEVTLAAPAEARIHEEAKRYGIPVATLPIGRRNVRGFLALRRWLMAHPVDVINTHSSTDSWLSALVCASLRSPPGIVRTRHISAPVPNDPGSRWLYRRAPRHVVTTGEQLRESLIRANGLAPARVTSVPTGVKPEVFSPGDRAEARRITGLPAETTLIGTVATLRSWKGHRYLIDAFAKLSGARLGLVIVGDGPQRDALGAQVASLELASRVVMPGNQRDVVPWLRALDVFALPSYANEGVPQALVQAMLVGLPCVTTNIGAIGEAARDGETALVVPPEDAEALAAALQKLIDAPQLRARLGAAARTHCESRFSHRAMLDRMEAIFRDAARKAQ